MVRCLKVLKRRVLGHLERANEVQAFQAYRFVLWCFKMDRVFFHCDSSFGVVWRKGGPCICS